MFHKAVPEVTIPQASDVTDYYDVAYLNSVSAGQTTMWNCTVQLNDYEVPLRSQSDCNLRRPVEVLGNE